MQFKPAAHRKYINEKRSVRKIVPFTEKNEFYNIVLIVLFLDRIASKAMDKIINDLF